MLQARIWKNYQNIELFPHKFSQYLLSEVGFTKCEVIGAPLHHSKGFQRPIKIFTKGGGETQPSRIKPLSTVIVGEVSNIVGEVSNVAHDDNMSGSTKDMSTCDKKEVCADKDKISDRSEEQEMCVDNFTSEQSTDNNFIEKKDNLLDVIPVEPSDINSGIPRTESDNECLVDNDDKNTLRVDDGLDLSSSQVRLDDISNDNLVKDKYYSVNTTEPKAR